MPDDTKKLLEKIQKLMNLGSSPNAHEAASAMAMAQRLMAEHDLTLSQVRQVEVSHVFVKSKFATSKPKGFEINLARTVASAFGCEILWHSSWSSLRETHGASAIFGSFIFVGKKSSLPLVEHLFIVLQRKLVSGRAEVVRGLPPGYDAKSKTLEGDGFCIGYVKAVRQHVVAMGSDVPKQVLLDYTQAHLNPSSKPTTASNTKAGAHGYQAGLEAGAKERLHRPMGSEAQLMIGGK